MKLDLRPLLAGERYLSFAYELPFDHDPDDAASFLYGVGFPSPMKVEGDITNTAGYMRMKLHMSVDYQTACARCLRPLSGAFALDLEKTVATKDVLRDIDEDRIDEYAVIENGFLDMDEQLRDQMEMEFPVRFLCKDDCKGLCPKCGADLNEGDCGCETREVDPRLKPLQAILDRMKAEEQNQK